VHQEDYFKKNRKKQQNRIKLENIPVEESATEVTTPEVNQERIQAEKEVRDWAKKTVQEWHDKVVPDYIFVTETAGVSFGYVLKETWKEAYGGEKTPEFRRIDPKSMYPMYNTEEYFDLSDEEKNAKRRLAYEAYCRGVRKYFERRIKKDDAKIIVFDEATHDRSLVRQDERGDYSGGSLSDAASWVSSAYSEDYDYGKILHYKPADIWTVSSHPKNSGNSMLLYGGYFFPEIKEWKSWMSNRPTSKSFANYTKTLAGTISSSRSKSADELKIRRKILEKLLEDDQFTLAAKIVKEPEQRKRAIKFVDELKRIGQEAGKELLAELQNKREA